MRPLFTTRHCVPSPQVHLFFTTSIDWSVKAQADSFCFCFLCFISASRFFAVFLGKQSANLTLEAFESKARYRPRFWAATAFNLLFSLSLRESLINKETFCFLSFSHCFSKVGRRNQSIFLKSYWNKVSSRRCLRQNCWRMLVDDAMGIFW